MKNIEKDKNFYYFTVKDGRKVKFDLNTGIMYGLSGKPVKNTPTGVATVIEKAACGWHSNPSNVINYMYRMHYRNSIPYSEMSECKDMMMFLDKLDNIGVVYQPYSFNDESIDYTKNNFERFCHWFKDHKSCREPLNTFMRDDKVNQFISHSPIKIDDHFTMEMARSLMDTAIEEKYYPYAAYYMSHGMWELFEDYNYKMYGLFRNYFKWCECLGKEPVKTNNFATEYKNVHAEYQLNKDKVDNAAIKICQDKHKDALTFETDELTTVIPYTSNEFVAEGTEQSNCVARLYLPKVIDGTTNIVFIREKNNPDHSYITCEVKNGEIYQYLARYNSRVTEQRDLDFKDAFQKHIKENW